MMFLEHSVGPLTCLCSVNDASAKLNRTSESRHWSSCHHPLISLVKLLLCIQRCHIPFAGQVWVHPLECGRGKAALQFLSKWSGAGSDGAVRVISRCKSELECSWPAWEVGRQCSTDPCPLRGWVRPFGQGVIMRSNNACVLRVQRYSRCGLWKGKVFLFSAGGGLEMGNVAVAHPSDLVLEKQIHEFLS